MRDSISRPLFCAFIVLAVALGRVSARSDSHPPMPDPGQGYFVMNEGNSLMGQMHTNMFLEDGKVTLLPGMADFLGFPEHRVEGVGAAGVPIDYIWIKTHKREEFFQDLAGNPVELFTVQPFGFQNHRTPQVEAAAAAQMYRHVIEKNPDAPLLIYQTWPSGRSPGGSYHDLGPALENNGGDAEKYLRGLQKCIDGYMNPVAHILRQEFPDRPVYIIPAPQAIAEVGRRLEEADEFAGIQHVAELLFDGGRSVHLSRKGQFLVAMTQLASIYRTNPAEADIPVDYKTVFAFALKEGPQSPGLTAEQGKRLAQLAWDVVRTYPATPVSHRPFEFDDMVKPQPASTEDVRMLNTKQALVQWSPGSDNTGVDKQVVYLDGNYRDTLPPEDTDYRIGSLDTGENTFLIRTFDKNYNMADLQVEIQAPPVRGETAILAWDLSPYTLNAEYAKKHPEYSLATKIEVTESSGVDASRGAITFGPGAHTASRPFRHCMIISPDRAESFAAAHEAGTYVTFTVAPKEGRTLALKSLVLPLKTNESGLSVALMASKTGFEKGDQIGSVVIEGGLSEVEFPLHEVEQLQSVSEPVEFRLYFSQGHHQTYIGTYQDPDREPDVWLRGDVK